MFYFDHFGNVEFRCMLFVWSVDLGGDVALPSKTKNAFQRLGHLSWCRRGGGGYSGYPISSFSLKNFSDKAPQSATCTRDVDLPLMIISYSVHSRSSSLTGLYHPESDESSACKLPESALFTLFVCCEWPTYDNTARRSFSALGPDPSRAANRTEQLIAVTSLLARPCYG